MDHASPRLTRGSAVAAALVALSMLAGCGQPEPQTRVTRGPVETTQTVLSAIERGELRTEVLKTARPAWDAYVAMDIEAMEPLFAPSLVERRAELRAEYEREGREPHDFGEIVSLDVVTMSPDGARIEVLIELIAADGSTVDPAGMERKANLMLERDEAGGYRVTSVIAAGEPIERD